MAPKETSGSKLNKDFMSEINITKETIYTIEIDGMISELDQKSAQELYQKLGTLIAEGLTQPSPFLAVGSDLPTHVGTGNPTNWQYSTTVTTANGLDPRTQGPFFIGSSNGGSGVTSHAGGASTLV